MLCIYFHVVLFLSCAARAGLYVYVLFIRAQRALRDAGVRWIASTDAGIPGVEHHRLAEGLLAFQRYAELDCAAVLRSATSESARALEIDAETGSIREGLVADLLVVEGDPLSDLRALLRPLAVFARGVPIAAEPLAD